MTRYLMKQKLFSLGDDFIIRDEDGEDDVLLLASTVVIDMACHPDHRE